MEETTETTNGGIKGNAVKQSRMKKDLTGWLFGRWEVLGPAYCKHGQGWYWHVKCRCERQTTKTLLGSRLTQELTRSCGCNQREQLGDRRRKHGKSTTPEYGVYSQMIYRCLNSECKAYPNYGGRGITVCNRWQGDEGFVNFYFDMGKRPSNKYSLERKDNNGNYCPENCEWATKIEQDNNKRNNRMIEYEGEAWTLAQWCRKFGVKRGAIDARMKYNKMSFADAVKDAKEYAAEPVRKYEYRGENKTAEELEAIAGVLATIIRSRVVYMGWDVERAVHEEVREKRESREVEYAGQTWSLTALAKHVGLRPNTLKHRLDVQKMSLEDAINTPSQKAVKRVS